MVEVCPVICGCVWGWVKSFVGREWELWDSSHMRGVARISARPELFGVFGTYGYFSQPLDKGLENNKD